MTLRPTVAQVTTGCQPSTHARPCGQTASRVGVDVRHMPHLAMGQYVPVNMSAINVCPALRPGGTSVPTRQHPTHASPCGSTAPSAGVLSVVTHLPLRFGGLLTDFVVDSAALRVFRPGCTSISTRLTTSPARDLAARRIFTGQPRPDRQACWDRQLDGSYQKP